MRAQSQYGCSTSGQHAGASLRPTPRHPVAKQRCNRHPGQIPLPLGLGSMQWHYGTGAYLHRAWTAAALPPGGQPGRSPPSMPQPLSPEGLSSDPLPPGLITASFTEADSRSDSRPPSSAGGASGVTSTAVGGSSAASGAGSGSSAPRASSSSPAADAPGAGGTGAPGAAQAAPQQPTAPATPVASAVFSIKPVYIVLFALIFTGGLLFASASLQLTSDIAFSDALTMVRRAGWAS